MAFYSITKADVTYVACKEAGAGPEDLHPEGSIERHQFKSGIPGVSHNHGHFGLISPGSHILY